MARKTIYCAQGFWWRRGAWHVGELYEFSTAPRALEGADILARWAAGAVAFSLTGEPDTDYWSEPVILQRIGLCPGLDDRQDAVA